MKLSPSKYSSWLWLVIGAALLPFTQFQTVVPPYRWWPRLDRDLWTKCKTTPRRPYGLH